MYNLLIEINDFFTMQYQGSENKFSKQIAKVQEILGLLCVQKTLSSINHIFKSFPILLAAFVLG